MTKQTFMKKPARRIQREFGVKYLVALHWCRENSTVIKDLAPKVGDDSDAAVKLWKEQAEK